VSRQDALDREFVCGNGLQKRRQIQELEAAGCASLRAIAAGLEERGIPGARRQVVCGAGQPIVGGGPQPFRRKRRHRRRVKAKRLGKAKRLAGRQRR
jgi:hypothetical protein